LFFSLPGGGGGLTTNRGGGGGGYRTLRYGVLGGGSSFPSLSKIIERGPLATRPGKVEEKRENFSLRKPGEREREKYFAPFFWKFPIQKGRKLFSEKTEKT
jgi:hypothetical protein